MFRLWVENEKNEKEELTSSPFYESVVIDGLLPPKVTFNSSSVAGKDGERDIGITVKPAYPVEENRQRLYRYFKVKKEVKLYFKNENRNLLISGKVESFNGSLFEQKQTIVIDIRCFEPYFKDSKESAVSMSSLIDLFEFPFSIGNEGIEFSRLDKALTQNIYNAGDTETGMIIELSANGEVINPTIYNVETREYFGLNITMQYGDLIRINTNAFNKKVELVRYGESRNIINNIKKGNKWFQITPGDNVFTYQCERGEEFLNFKFIYSNLFEGV